MTRPNPCRAIYAGALLLLGATLTAAAADRVSGPRFASLRAAEVNMRAGPGTQFPVEWVFERRALPVEIVVEYGRWRKIRDADGSEGWVHKSLLSSRRTVMISGGVRTLRRAPIETAEPVLRAEPGVLGRLIAAEGGWCRVEIAGVTGWIERHHLWGVTPDETVK